MKAAPQVSSGNMASNAATMSILRRLGIRLGQLPVLILTFVVICIVLKLWPSSDLLGLGFLGGEPDVPPVPESQKHDKWIVVTTIQSPTDSVKKLAQLPGWRLVVVGDSSTPKDWNVPGAVYLSVEMQKELPYKLVNLLPYKSYARKNLGYLYAIQHGAKVIYETDDDNFAEDGIKNFRLSDFSWSLIIDTHNLTYNPYVHFGQSTTWPRGYPLEYLPLSTPHKHKLCRMPTAAAQQGLVNGDPDLDATFRLTRKNSLATMDLSFDHRAPSVVLPAGTFAPFNCQDTLFSYSAFWSLMLPLSKHMRTLDIFRAYMAEKLLWLIGQRLEFIATETNHKRNFHSYIKDASNEVEFLKMGTFIDVLQKWKCEKLTLFGCMEEAYEMARAAGFFDSRDVDAVKAWLKDLTRIGYKAPALNKARDTCVEAHDKESVFFYGEEQSTIMFHTADKFVLPGSSGKEFVNAELHAMCSGKVAGAKFSPAKHPVRDKLLIIDVAGAYESIPALDAWYRPLFSQVLYCGHGKTGVDQWSQMWMVSIIAPASGRVSSMSGCLYLASKMGYKTTGFMYIQKDMLFSYESLNSLASSVKMTQNIVQSTSPCQLDCLPVSKEDIEKFGTLKPNLPEFRSQDQDTIMACAKRFADSFTKEATFQHTIAFYLPAKENIRLPIMRFAEAYLQAFSAQIADVFTAVISTCIDPNHSPFLYASFQQKLTADYIHPFDFDKVRTDNHLLSFYCANVTH